MAAKQSRKRARTGDTVKTGTFTGSKGSTAANLGRATKKPKVKRSRLHLNLLCAVVFLVNRGLPAK